MYSCGSSNIAKFFSGKANHTAPTNLKCFSNLQIRKICISQCLAILLLEDGSVHSFGSDGQIVGHAEHTSKVTSLETIQVVDVSVGYGHLFAVDESGRVFGWGQNTNGQLGWKESSSYLTPKLVKPIQNFKINMIACGDDHSLFLGFNGSVWSAGKNSFGQLGNGGLGVDSIEIQFISSLKGIPFQHVAAGSWHSFALTVSGTVFGWGRNDFGQLGLGDVNNRTSPSLLKSIRTQYVKYICAGKYHTAVLTKEGRVFTFGLNSYGQLGHGRPAKDDKQPNYFVAPQQIFELMGTVVTQIACGSLHTLTFVPESGQVYGFGSNELGQLGNPELNSTALFLPCRLTGPWIPSSAQIAGTSFSKTRHSSCFLKDVYAGSEESVIVTSTVKKSTDFRNVPQRKKLFSLNEDLISNLEKLAADSRMPPDLKKYFETVISSPACLNGSFLEEGHYRTNSNYHGINLMSVRLLFSKLNFSSCKELKALMSYNIQKQLIPNLPDNPPDIEALRIFLFLPECLLFDNKEFYSTIAIPFARKCNGLSGGALKVLNNWYLTLEPMYFIRQVDIYLNSIRHLLSRQLHFDNNSQMYLKGALDFLKNLNNVNSLCQKPLISYQKFYLPDIADLVNLEDDYVRWYSHNMQSVTFCSYPFLLNSNAKSSLLQIDATWQMRAAYSQAQEQNIASIFGLANYETPVLNLEINREDLVQDTMTALASVDIQSFKKPLVVKFKGEDGQDAGGVRKEFFMLILKEVIDPKYGMFRFFDESRLIWFSDYELETDMMYFLVGIVCGLAIYNNTIIDLCFPLALYKKLLGEKIYLADLFELDPTVAKNMRLLLDYKDFHKASIEDIFCLNFTIDMDNFGEIRTIDLIPDGSNVTVNEKNREKYVESYIDYVFNKSVSHQFEAFSKGFLKVCGGQILQLFRPMELMEMVVGNQNYNWEEFEKQASYKGEYYRNHPTIALFWEVFHAFSLEEKKNFLLFLTGSNKIPINGIKIFIQPIKLSEDYLPVAHTCFNLLDLPLYKTKEKLKAKLQQAMLNNQGFHLA